MTPRELRAFVRTRAQERCEYCRLRQEDLPVAIFHVEHIIPQQHGGQFEAGNLALACQSCNLHKGPNLTGIDPETGAITPLFNPRSLDWDEHFKMDWPEVRGMTAIGRVTVRVLAMNAATRIELRAALGRPS